MKLSRVVTAFAAAFAAAAQQPVDVVQVVARSPERRIALPGEFQPYLAVDVQARVAGFVEKVLVDRGSVVKEGDLLAVLAAPELKAHTLSAEARVQAAASQRSEAEARQVAAESTFERLKRAAGTRGAVSGNELIQAEKAVDAARAQVSSAAAAEEAAKGSAAALRDMENYLRVTAPFPGIVTERRVHPGALVGPAAPAPLFRLEQTSRLRLVVAVPEVDVSGIERGAHLTFTVAAWPEQVFHGTVARVAHSMDPKTRSMAVELDVANPRNVLAPGMYPTVNWPVRKSRPSLMVPPGSVATTTERTFVVRVRNNVLEWVDVVKGPSAGGLVEVRGALNPGDEVLQRASDEFREGTRVTPRATKPAKAS